MLYSFFNYKNRNKMSTLYESISTTVGGRTGHTSTDDNVIDLNLSTPESMGGKGEKGTNPEQLLGCAYAACFGSGMKVIADKMRVDIGDDYSVTAYIGFCKDEEGAYLEATLDCYLPGVDIKTGEKIISKAHEICPFSKATRDNITVNLNLLIDE